MMKKLIVSTVALVFFGFFPSAQALPPVEADLTIGGVVVTEPNGNPSLNLAEPVSLLMVGSLVGGQCLGQEPLTTAPNTNSFLMEFDWASCEGVVLETLGAVGHFGLFLDGELRSSLEVSTQLGFFVEILQLTRSTPTSPITLLIETPGFPIPADHDLRVTPRVIDSEGNTLFQGNDAVASPDGVGPVSGGQKFSYVLDPIPEDVELQNIDRFLQLELAAVQGGVVQGNPAQLEPFQLTYPTSSGCMELLQFGPGGLPALSSIQASVGCSVLASPPSCLDKTSEAIVAARAYKKSTRKVRRQCGKKITSTCSEALVSQSTAYQTLTEAQEQVELMCLP